MRHTRALLVLLVGCSNSTLVSSDAGDDSGLPVVSGGGDGGDATTTDATTDQAAKWTPASMSGLVLWTESTNVLADGGAITTWPDLSGKKHDLTSTAAAPSLVTSSIGGLPAVRFTGGAQQDLSASLDAVNTDPFLVEIVLRANSCSGGCGVWELGSVSQGDTYCNIVGNNVTVAFQNIAPDHATATLAAGGHVVGLHRISDTSAELRLDGKASPFTLVQNPNYTFPYPAFGVGENNFYDFDGDVAEIVIADSPTSGDIDSLEVYLKTKYGL